MYKNAVISLVPDRNVDLLVSHKYLHLHLYIHFDYTPVGVAVVGDFFFCPSSYPLYFIVYEVYVSVFGCSESSTCKIHICNH